MIYLIGGAPRAGKSIPCQQFSIKSKAGWVSTDLLMELLRIKKEHGIKIEWNAATEAVTPICNPFGVPGMLSNVFGDV